MTRFSILKTAVQRYPAKISCSLLGPVAILTDSDVIDLGIAPEVPAPRKPGTGQDRRLHVPGGGCR